MFLNQLYENEKRLFLNLSLYAARANDVIENDEIKMIQEYCREMQITFSGVDTDMSLSDLYSQISLCEYVHRKIMLFEIVGFMYAEGTFDDQEKAFVIDFAQRIGIAKDDLVEEVNLVNRYVKLTREIATALESEKVN